MTKEASPWFKEPWCSAAGPGGSVWSSLASGADSLFSPVSQIQIRLGYVPAFTLCHWNDKNTVGKNTFFSCEFPISHLFR